MVNKTINKLPKAIVEVSVTVPWADVSLKWNETLQKLSTDLELPGFRKGQAPVDLVEQRIGTQVQQEVLKVVMPQALIEALQGTNIVPIDYPRYQVMSFNKGADLSFKATVTERPSVKVGIYKGIKVVRPELKVITDEQVKKLIDDLYKRWKLRNPNKIATSPTPSNGATGVQGASGSMQFGAQAGGQTTQPNVDTPNDEFAKGVGAASLEDLKRKMKADLEAEAKYNNELDYEEAILQEVEKITEVDIPDILIQDELNRMLVSLQRRVADMGLLLDDYLKGQKKTVDQLKQEWKNQAEKNVRMELGLSQIATSEGVNIADEELQAEIDKIQDNRVKMQFDNQEPRMHLRHALRQTKTLNLLKTIAN